MSPTKEELQREFEDISKEAFNAALDGDMEATLEMCVDLDRIERELSNISA